MYLLKTDIHHSDPQMAMSQYMDMGPTQAMQGMDTTTTVMWWMKEDMQHLEIPIYRKVLKRREIETINPLEISTQIVSDPQRRNVRESKKVNEREVIMNEVNQRKRIGLVA